jgi:hypothetical protein
MSKPRIPVVYIEGGDGNYRRLAGLFGAITMNADAANLIMFTGGSDVTPSLYGETKLRHTANNPERDAAEVSLYHRLRADGKQRAFVGICRGGQFLNVMNGGKMWQHVEGHVKDHPVFDIATEKAYHCTSTHHQMMRAPTNGEIKYEILAYALDRNGLKKRVDTEKLIPDNCKWEHDGLDIEAMWYPDTRSLCFQPHPEFEGYPTCSELFLHYVHKHVIPSLYPEKAPA